MNWPGWLSSPRRRERLTHWMGGLGLVTALTAGAWVVLGSLGPDFPTEPVSSVRLNDDSPEDATDPHSDLQSVAVRRTRADLRVVLHYASALNRNQMASVEVKLTDPGGLRWEVIWGRHREDGHWRAGGGVDWDDGDALFDRTCSGLHGDLNPDARTLALRVPIRCLTPPRYLPGQSHTGTPPKWLRLESVTLSGPRSTDDIFGAYNDRPVLIAG